MEIKNMDINDTTIENRKLIASLYLKGNGIEIGALHQPLYVSNNAKVTYVDRMSAEDLRKQYPELNSQELVNVDIIDNGEVLEKISDNSQDFVIINHFIEHCKNPLLAIENILRVTKDTGYVYISVPDKRYTFDVDRPVTTFEHVEEDYLDKNKSQEEHFTEWAKYVNKYTGEEIEKASKFLMSIDYSIHYHVWTQDAFLELLMKSKQYILSFNIEMMYRNNKEIIFILSKK